MFGLPATAAIWVGAGVTGAVASLMLPKEVKVSNIWGKGDAGYLGASGSVLGIISAITCVMPRAKVLLFPIVSWEVFSLHRDFPVFKGGSRVLG